MFKIVGVINYLIVVFLNAFTDLGHKIIIQNTIFKVYDGEMQIVLTAIVNALILLPFILLFSPSGFLADRFAKSTIMKHSSALAVVITLLITYSYYEGWFYTAFFMTFMLALQSAIYSPAKYGYIKELVGLKFISLGNGAVQAVTTVAILSGIIFYTVLFEISLADNFETKEDVLKAIAPLGWLLVLGSVIEWFLASNLPNMMVGISEKRFSFKRYLRAEYLQKNIKTLKRNREIFDAILALSLFWSISQVVLAIFGEFAKGELGITNAIYVQGAMAMAGFGIIAGSFLAASLSKYYVNSGIATIGAIGITIVVLIIPSCESMLTLVLLFALFGIFSGFIMVPLNSLIQLKAPRVHLGIILAGNNFVQNIFMVSFLLLTTLFAFFGTSAVALFYLMGLVGVYLSFILLKRYFVISFWALVEMLLKIRYRFRYEGLENIPEKGGVLLLGNHVSWIDWAIIQIPIKKRINFMIDKEIYNNRLFNTILKKGELIPISKKASNGSFKEASMRLKNGKIVALFPEGKISPDGELGEFYKGYEFISSDYDGSICTFFIDGMQGSIFSKKKEFKFSTKRDVVVYFSKPISRDTKVQEVKDIIKNLKDEHETKQA
ncbi:MAG: MFS transporter [Sulfurimonas sp.]|uniref:MFS transporter n=1 Tax=Sulfurimonas sp. TaxID=2022749 RepID=UPI0025E3DFA9|nr:MFS transporter [Sulfurimonas sp.]MCK9491209.1 MFS transporter [Sulfurimonas sp.]